jgi:hypothetical protein
MTKNRFDKEHLLEVLTEESSFYRALHVLIDRQREGLRENSDVRMCDLFTEIGRVQKRIESSEQTIQSARRWSPEAFADWARSPEVRSILDEISGLIMRSQSLVAECLRIARAKRVEYQHELGQMNQGRRLFASMTPTENGPRFLDARP